MIIQVPFTDFGNKTHHDTQFKLLNGKLREKGHDSETKEILGLRRKLE